MKRLLILLFILTAVGIHTGFAQETASSLAKKLEDQFLKAPAISAQFDLNNEGRVKVTADVRNNKIRIENSHSLLISNGKTIWNYGKQANRVTIDAIAANSPLKDPAGLFRFSSNYY